ncbi:hypothetical protein [Roseicyclus salinarum]|uniref:hypothetical protein n=1 Tax=Roseicyclus salinarum TaxID=3036773 RepID=UPI0024155BCA|nr:hypothetical protein [Roseibacterium sp. SDUM158017]
MRGIVLAAALTASPAAAQPTCAQVADLARIMGEMILAVSVPAEEIGQAITIDRLTGGSAELHERIMPRAIQIQSDMADHGERAMELLRATGCAP